MSHWIKNILLSCCLLLTACQQEDKNALKVGTIAGPETQLMQVAQQVAKEKYGLNIRIVEFTDYTLPNIALNDGSIDANMFQHLPYLEQQIKDRGYHLVSVAKTFVYPMGIYSDKVKSIKALPMAAIVAIPNDASNEGRALLLLQKAGLIKLKKSVGLYATPAAVITNPKQLQFKELDAAQLPRSLPDVTLAVINTNYAIPAGLSPDKDAIYKESNDSPYANIIVVRAQDVNNPRIKQLIAAVQSAQVLQSAKTIFSGYAIPAWKSH